MGEDPKGKDKGGLGLLKQGLLFWLLKGGFRVSSGTVKWYISSYATDFDNSEMASPVKGSCKPLEPREYKGLLSRSIWGSFKRGLG